MAAQLKMHGLTFRTALRAVVGSSYFFWAVLALPSIQLMLTLEEENRRHRGPSAAHEIVEGSGIFATLLLLIALSLSPLQTIFPNSRVVGWLLRRRRYIGVAAFSYSVVHLAFYFVDVGTLQEVLSEFAAPGILTGWVALFVFIPLVVTSNAVMTRALGWRIGRCCNAAYTSRPFWYWRTGSLWTRSRVPSSSLDCWPCWSPTGSGVTYQSEYPAEPSSTRPMLEPHPLRLWRQPSWPPRTRRFLAPSAFNPYP